MHPLARYALTVIALAFATVILEPAASGALLAVGINTDVIAPLVSRTAASLLSQAWFGPAAYIAIGATLGAWVERYLSNLKPKTDKFETIGRDLMRSSVGLRSAKQRDYRVRPEIIQGHAMNFRGALRSLEKEGFTVPWVEFDADPVGFIDLSIRFVDRIVPLLARGHITEARKMSAEEAEHSKTYMAARDRL